MFELMKCCWQEVAEQMGLDIESNVSLWKDTVMVEINKAVLYSFQVCLDFMKTKLRIHINSNLEHFLKKSYSFVGMTQNGIFHYFRVQVLPWWITTQHQTLS